MIGTLLSLIVYLLVLGVLLWLVFYVLAQFPPPEPIARIVKVVITIIAVLIALALALQLLGGVGISVPRL